MRSIIIPRILVLVTFVAGSSARALHADPWIETARLIHAGGSADDAFGASVAIDGDTAVVGQPIGALVGMHVAGAAYVFVRSGGAWTEAATLVPSDGAIDDAFGNSVAISGDTIVVGAPGAALGDVAAEGKAYVFVRPSGGWAGVLHENAQLGNFLAAGATGPDGLGFSVSISGDTVVAGAPESFSQSGLVFVFVEPGATGWTSTIAPSAFLEASSGDHLGFSAAISGDTVVAGATYFSETGSAFVWVRPTGGWSDVLLESADLLPSAPSPGGEFGRSVAIDGTTAVVGAPGAVDSDYRSNAYVFQRPAGGWAGTLNESARLLPRLQIPPGPQLQLGNSVVIEGDTVVAGAPGETVFPFSYNDGAAYLFRKPASGWSGDVRSRTEILNVDNGAHQSLFGWSIGISGSTIVAGAKYETVGVDAAQGAVHVFEPGLDPTVTVAFSPGSVLTNQPSTLTLTISNPNATGFLWRLATRTPAFPSGLAIDSVPNAATTCGGNVFPGMIPGDTSLGLEFGDPLFAGGSCIVSANVSSLLPGTFTTAASPVSCDQDCDGIGSAPATLLVRLRFTQTRILVQGPIRVAPGVPVEFPFEVSAERGEIAGPTGEVVVSDGEGHACRASAGADGRGSCAITFGAAGRFQVRAQYLGNLSFGGSTSPPASVFVR